MSGFPDTTNLDEKSKNVLAEAYRELMRKVEQDATPENLEKLKSQLFQGKVTPASSFTKLAKIFEDSSVNLFDLPFDVVIQAVEQDAVAVEKEENDI